jgi:hypothetical protein
MTYRFKSIKEMQEEFGPDWMNIGPTITVQMVDLFFRNSSIYESDKISNLGEYWQYKEWTICSMFLTHTILTDEQKLAIEKTSANKKLLESQLILEVVDNKIIRFTDTRGYRQAIEFCRSPTGNCQLCSIIGFDTILLLLASGYLSSMQAYFIIQKILLISQKRIALFDIKNKWFSTLEILTFSVSFHYVSTNDSSMGIGLIKEADNNALLQNLLETT